MTELTGFETFLENLKKLNSFSYVAEITMTVLVGLVLGVIIYFTYKLTCRSLEYDYEFGIVLLIIPVVISLMIGVIGTNIARAFSLAGALSIIRYRSGLMRPKNVAFVFFGMGAGLACGVGLYLPALVFVILLAVVVILYTGLAMETDKKVVRVLKITIPEHINFDGMFDETLKKYASEFRLSSVQLVSGGTVYELNYTIRINDMKQAKALIDEVRVKNANFNVQLMQRQDAISYF